MMIEEFTERTGISPVEATVRWKEILHDYLADFTAWREVLDPNYQWQNPFETAEDTRYDD